MRLSEIRRVGEFAVVLSTLPLASLVQSQSVQQIAKDAFPAVVLLVMEDQNGQPMSLGSGFFVADDVVATNLHVIQGTAKGYAKPVGQEAKYDIEGIVAIDPQRDLVLLRITGTKSPCLRLGDSRDIAIGDEVYVVGNPMGLEGTFSRGIVSGVRQIELDTLFQITAPISPGSSGGPVLNKNGEVIGVAVATFRGGQNLNFALPVHYLVAILESLEPVKPLSVWQPHEGHQSVFDAFGGPSIEGVIGERFIWDFHFPEDAGFSFTLRNKLRQPAAYIKCLVVIYDRSGAPLDF